MVTRSVIRITTAETESAAKDSNRDDNDNQLQNGDDDDDYKHHDKNHGEEIQLGNINEGGCLSKAADGEFCDGNSRQEVSSPHCEANDDTINEGTAVDIRRHDNNTSKKRPLLLEDADNNNGEKKRTFIDLTDVPPQSPMLKSSYKDGASKYQGVYFDKTKNKWRAKIMIDKVRHHIGRYDDEEEAAIDYARAVFKYKAGGVERKMKTRQKFIDLTDVPTQSPIIRSGGKDCSSKYEGVFFHKASNKWQAQIIIDRKQYNIGLYDIEEEAAMDYARAVFKYNAGGVKGQRKKRQTFIDLTDVPPQSPLLRSDGKDGASKYQGVAFDNSKNKKWRARITIDGKRYRIGVYENEEEAAIDYARAVFKYKASINHVRPLKPVWSNSEEEIVVSRSTTMVTRSAIRITPAERESTAEEMQMHTEEAGGRYAEV
jgi:hypothetical protein